MLDALLPGLDAWLAAIEAKRCPSEAFAAAAAAAEAGAAASAIMTPRAGRAAYMGDRALGVPDGGAVAVAIWMKAVASVLGY
jgi:dihydroxyacetone kinase